MDKIAVLDFGGQYAHLIANRVRRLGVYTEILQPSVDIKELEGFKGIIYSGGPSSVYDDDAPAYNENILALNIPKLGICYGHQLISNQCGGRITPGKVKEYGVADLKIISENSPLLKDIPKKSPMWMSHGDMVSKIPDGFKAIAITDDCSSAAVSNRTEKIYGIQFHPEVTHSKFGMKLLENFIDICECERTWDMKSYLQEITHSIKESCQNKKVFLLVSGGVDSTVAFVLLNKILGKDRVLGLHIDNGMMRLNESADVMDFLHKADMENLIIANASDTFLKNLEKKIVPEEKRKIIGDTFLQIKDEEIARLELNPKEWILAQGTIYPDTIESGGTDNAEVIKTHHNRVEAIMDLLEKGEIIEPLSGLYKDEVRMLGAELKIPHELLWRHPFPGPGLGVRLLCSDASEKAIENSKELKNYLITNNLEGNILPIQSVGVQGDGRTYAHPFLLKTNCDWSICETHSTAITNRFTEINRSIYQIAAVSDEAPKLVPQYCEKINLDQLRIFDDICTKFLKIHNLYNDIWQMPVVLLPLRVNQKPVVVMRPINSSEAMTANFAEIDQELLRKDLWPSLEAVGAGALYYDITHKPPGTIEWE